MANGLRCTKCGYQETEHIHPELERKGEPVCTTFTLSKKDQLIQNKISKQEKEERDFKNRCQDTKVLIFLTPYGAYTMDIGS